MAIRNCTTCIYAEWARQKSGRRIFESGVCHVEITFPNSFLRGLDGGFPKKVKISKRTINGCLYWKRLLGQA